MAHTFPKLIFLTCLLFFCGSASAQPQKNYLFTRFGKVNGLAADLAYCVAQDKQGFIWIGTDRGLQRYDGKRFVTFRNEPGDPNSLPYNAIGSMRVDKKGRLWITFFGKQVGFLNTSTFRFTLVKMQVPEEFRKNNMERFLEDDDGTLHISVQNYGVLTYNEEKNEFSASYNRVNPPGGGNAIEINRTRTNGVYLVTGRNGVDLYNSNTREWVPRSSSGLLRNMNRVLQAEGAMGPAHIFEDKKGRTWFDLWLDNRKDAGPQVYSYHPFDDSWHTYKKSVDSVAKGYHSINGFLEQQNGDIWIYGTTLFAKFNEQTRLFEDVRNETLKLNGIVLETIYQLFEDKDGNIWICGTNGLFMFNPSKQVFSNIPNRRHDPTPQVYSHSTDAVLQSQSGIIYTSTWGAGLFTYDNNFNVVPNPIIPTPKGNYGFAGWDMHERKNGEIWVAVQGGSLKIFNPVTKVTVDLKLSVFEGKTVRQVIEDSLGNIWMGSQYGLVIKCTNANWRDTANAFKVMHSFKGRITKLVADKNGFVWVCTDRYGLYKLKATDGSIVDHYDEAGPVGKRLQIAGANDILQYNDSIMLIASGDVNILNTKTNTITYAGAGGGIEHSYLSSIIKDRLGYIWLAFSDGLGRMEFGKEVYLYFGPEDGILNNHFQINAATILKDGRILLGTNTDMLVFDPTKISLPQKAVPVSISGFQLSDKDLLVDSLLLLKKIKLPYYNNTFSIDLTTFNFHNDHAIMYMLEGVDKDWVFSATHKVTYYRLPPGNYTFKTKTISATGEESEITQIVIDIVPPFWDTWWFYGLLILSGLLVFYLADRERLLRIRGTQKLRTDIALSLHHEVNTALNNINLLSEMARMKADKDITRSKALIEQISEKSNDMIIAMDDMLWVIDPENDSMEKIVLRMNEFIDALRNRHAAEIDIHIDSKVKNLKLGMKARHGFFVIFKKALRCMVQYSGAVQTLVNIELENNNLRLTMQGATPLNNEHLQVTTHLQEIKALARDINAGLDVENDNSSCSLVLMLPVK